MSEHDIQKTLRGLLGAQQFGVLATSATGQPYTSLVAFVAGPDLTTLYFATTRATRKYANLSADPRVSFLIDSRSNSASDVQEAIATTVTGRCTETTGDEREAALALYLAKHPYLEDFVVAPTCALLRFDVDSYYLVDRFQHVVEWRVTAEEQH